MVDTISFDSSTLNKNNNLSNYYYYFNYLGDEDINKIIHIASYYNKVDGKLTNGLDYTYRKSQVTGLPLNNDTRFMYDIMIYLLHDANNNMWNFIITNIVDNLQLSEYTEHPDSTGDHYDWHMDIGTDIFSTRKISMSIQLSDENDYEGGNLEFMINRSIIQAPRQKGSVILFPSYLLHRVTNVTKGTRKSLVMWFNGPPFT